MEYAKYTAKMHVGTHPACYLPHVPHARLPKDWISEHCGT